MHFLIKNVDFIFCSSKFSQSFPTSRNRSIRRATLSETWSTEPPPPPPRATTVVSAWLPLSYQQSLAEWFRLVWAVVAEAAFWASNYYSCPRRLANPHWSMPFHYPTAVAAAVAVVSEATPGTSIQPVSPRDWPPH